MEDAGYKPSQYEEQRANEMMTDTEGIMSHYRERVHQVRERFGPSCEEYERYLELSGLSGVEKIETRVKLGLRGDPTSIYGTGMQSRFISNRDAGQFTDFIYDWMSHAKRGRFDREAADAEGDNWSNALREGKYKISDEAIAAGEHLAGVYDRNCQRIIAKSGLLQTLMAPLEGEGEFTDEELEQLNARFKEYGLRSVEEFTGGAHEGYRGKREGYRRYMQWNFGSLFNEIAAASDTPEEVEQYRKQIDEALERLEAA